MLLVEYNEELIRKYDRKEGFDKGIEQGINYLNELNSKLIDSNRTEDMIRASKDKKYQRQLLHEFFPDIFSVEEG